MRHSIILFVLNLWWCILRNIVSRQVNSALFLTSVIFTISIFPLWYASAVPRNWDSQRKFGGTVKKNFPARAPQLQNRVGAYDAMDFPGFGLSSG